LVIGSPYIFEPLSKQNFEGYAAFGLKSVDQTFSGSVFIYALLETNSGMIFSLMLLYLI
jgi:hypothetical protein